MATLCDGHHKKSDLGASVCAGSQLRQGRLATVCPRRRLDGPFAGLMETLTMSKRSRKQFTIRLVVAIGVALGGISAIGSVIAYSAVERAWMIAQETATKPFRPPVPKAEFRLSDQQQLRRIFLGQ
jgi:hypothetical protein